MEIRGSHDKLTDATGWEPEIELDQTLLDTLDWWRDRITASEVTRMSEQRRALITGITGQDGSYLADLLLEKGYDVHGMVRRASTETFQRLQHIRDRITLHTGDLLDQRSLGDVMRECEPHEIYNLAAMSFVAASWTQPVLTADFTGVGVTRMLEAMREVAPEARFYQASSSEMFGKVPRGPAERGHRLLPAQPLRRGQGLRPLHYGELP